MFDCQVVVKSVHRTPSFWQWWCLHFTFCATKGKYNKNFHLSFVPFTFSCVCTFVFWLIHIFIDIFSIPYFLLLDRDHYQLGTLSHIINTRATGYQQLPEWPEDAPDPTVRNVEVVMPWTEKTPLTKKGKPKKEKSFYSSSESSSEGKSITCINTFTPTDWCMHLLQGTKDTLVLSLVVLDTG